MIKGFLDILWGFVRALRYPLYVLAVFLLLIGLSVTIQFILHWRELRSRPKSDFKPLHKRSLFQRIFFDAPKQWVLDFINRPANFFPIHGLIIFEGRQGSGKTSSMVHFIHELQQQYPNVKVTTNFAYQNEETPLIHWKQLISYKNGYEGVVAAIDELQNWFSSKQSATFPPEMLSVVTQNRKNRRVILGTAQNFYMISKDIRTQCTELRRCFTLGGVFTIVHRLRPNTDSAGNVVELKHLGFYCWVHSESERNSYDTYKCIEHLAASGFQERQSSSNTSVSVTLAADTKHSRKRR